MDNLTEREQKLVDYMKVMINAMTMNGIFYDSLIRLLNWRVDTATGIGLSVEFQDEMLKFMEAEFGLKYSKVDSHGKPLEEDNGRQEEN